jgi:hypothetical protein
MCVAEFLEGRTDTHYWNRAGTPVQSTETALRNTYRIDRIKPAFNGHQSVL